MPTIQEIKESRKALVQQMHGILDKATADKPLTAEDRQEYDRIEAEVDSMAEAIEAQEGDAKRREKLASLEDSLKERQGSRTQGRVSTPIEKPVDGKTPNAEAEAFKLAQKSGLNNYIVGGMHNMKPAEQAALQVDSTAAGGALVVPEEFMAELIKFTNDMVFMRQFGRVLPLTSADSIGVPSLEADPADADWTSELQIGGEDSTMTVGKRALTPAPLAKFIKVSRTLLRKSAVPVESLVRERLAYKFGISEERAFLNGTGASQPLGVFTASASGIPTGRDSSTGNTTTAVTADGLIHCKFNLKAQYMASPSTRWILNRTVVRDIRKLKDGNGQYLWMAGIGGTPDSILEVPYSMSEYAPNTMTTGLYVGLIGDLRYYWIAECLKFELQRLDELYAATNQVGFLGRMELDGMPVLAEAFSRLALA